MANKKRKLKILFLDILTDKPEFRSKVNKNLYHGGSYSDHVRKVFGLDKNEWTTIYADRDKFPKTLPHVDALVIGGSSKNPVKGENTVWMKNTYKFICRFVKNETPILGICGGLQFVVKALGGEVIYNPKGREFGTIDITVTNSDPIFHGINKHFLAQSNHVCMTKIPPLGARVLASSALCPIQGMAIGDKIRLVQFHPERRKYQTQAILRDVGNHPSTSKESYQHLMESIKDTTATDNLIIKNFLNYFVYPQV